MNEVQYLKMWMSISSKILIDKQVLKLYYLSIYFKIINQLRF